MMMLMRRRYSRFGFLVLITLILMLMLMLMLLLMLIITAMNISLRHCPFYRCQMPICRPDLDTVGQNGIRNHPRRQAGSVVSAHAALVEGAGVEVWGCRCALCGGDLGARSCGELRLVGGGWGEGRGGPGVVSGGEVGVVVG